MCERMSERGEVHCRHVPTPRGAVARSVDCARPSVFGAGRLSELVPRHEPGLTILHSTRASPAVVAKQDEAWAWKGPRLEEYRGIDGQSV